ncbi:MAG: glycosyltransferase family 39 protein, partial [Gemmatimonadales bacterium]
MTDTDRFEPRYPLLTATGILSLWVGILSLPMFAGRFIAPDASNDQYAAGYAFRQWLADQFKATGEIPLWNPHLFGGMPFVGGMHGDIFYPTAWLRLILPTHIAMDLGFVVHYVLAGLFLFLLLRRLGVSWTGAVTGGLAYQLSGVVASLVSPGHDGKLFVTALLPLALLALVMALRDRRPAGYSLLALTVGLGILSPHYQMVYYMLLVAGLFSLYLVFGAEDRPTPRAGVLALGAALAAVLVGFGVGAIQLLPFYQYVPFSPRAESYGGFAEATSYAIPWSHVPEFFLAGFTGSRETYWSANFGKLHSEYLGLPDVALAAFGGLHAGRRRLVIWLGGIGGLFLLIALGAATPFYQIWYAVMPFVKQTRAPGMAFFVVAIVIA